MSELSSSHLAVLRYPGSGSRWYIFGIVGELGQYSDGHYPCYWYNVIKGVWRNTDDGPIGIGSDIESAMVITTEAINL